MEQLPLSPYPVSAPELQAQLAAERRGIPFLVYRDGEGVQRVFDLGAAGSRVTLGRTADNGMALAWDPEVSRTHAELERLGDAWIVVDDGLSTNGSYVNGQRLGGRQRLADRDVLRFGATMVVYRHPGESAPSTAIAKRSLERAALSPTQRRVLVALCRPFSNSSSFPSPSTNQQIAQAVFLSVDAVKGHLRILFRKFGVDHLPPQQKRVALASEALRTGEVSFREL